MASRRRRKADSTSVARRPQSHGGALLAGGAPNNRGGTGRPPSAIRATARQAFDEVLPIVTRIVKSKSTSDRDRIRGIDVLGKYGMGHPVSIDDVRDRLREQLEAIREFLPPEQSEVLIGRLKGIWMDL